MIIQDKIQEALNENYFLLTEIFILDKKYILSSYFEEIIENQETYLPLINSYQIAINSIEGDAKSYIKIINNDIFDFLFKVNFLEIKINLHICAMENNTIHKQQIFLGIITDIKNENDYITIFFDSILKKLNQETGTFFSSTCRAEFGDFRCKKSLTGNEYNAKITQIISDRNFICDVIQSDIFTNGYCEFTSGANVGFKSKIVKYFNGEVAILLPVLHEININDEIKLTTGCNKTLSDCKKFDNIINFRAEPFIKKTQTP